MSEQISHFLSQVGKVFYGGLKPQSEESWDKVFALLTDIFEKTVSKNKKIIFMWKV